MLRFNLRPSLALAAGLLLSGSAVAQNKSGYWSRGFGNSWAGGSVYAKSGLRRTVSPRLKHVYGYLETGARGTVLKKSFQIGKLRFRAVQQAYNTGHKYQFGEVYLEAIGKRILNFRTNKRVSTPKKVWYFNAFPRDVSISWGWAFFKITLRANCGVAVKAWGELVFRHDFGMFGGAGGGASAYGRASAGVDVFIASLAVGVRLDLLDQTLKFLGGASPHGVSGFCDYELRPIIITLFLRACYRTPWTLFIQKKCKTWDLASWSAKAFKRSLFTL